MLLLLLLSTERSLPGITDRLVILGSQSLRPNQGPRGTCLGYVSFIRLEVITMVITEFQ